MALIICTECGREFSDKAEACPNCGCPTEYLKCEFQKEQIQTTEDNESKQETAAEYVSDKNVTNTEPEETGFVLVSEDEYQSGLKKSLQMKRMKAHLKRFHTAMMKMGLIIHLTNSKQH